MNGSSYTPGGWTALSCDGWVALVEPDAGDEIALELWRQGLRGATFVDGLSALSRAGLGALPSFALAVRGPDGSTNVAVRGPVRVEAVTDEGTTVVDGSAVSTWSERVLPSVHRLTAHVSGASTSPQLPLIGGLVRAAGLTVPAQLDLVGSVDEGATGADAVGTAPEPADAGAQPVGDQVDDDGATVGQDPLAPSGPDAPADGDRSADEPSDGEGPADRDGPAAHGADGDEPVPGEESAGEPTAHGAGVDEPVVLSAEQVPWDRPTQVLDPVLEPVLDPVREPAMAAAGAPTEAIARPPVASSYETSDDASFTIMSSSLADLRESLPVWDGRPAPTVQTAAAPVVKLVLSTGLVVALDRPVLLGRAPQASRIGGRDLPRLVAVPSPQQDISRTHAEVRVVGDDVLVTDLDSTNGVYLLAPGLGSHRLHPGEPTALGLDQTVDLGDGVTFTVERGT